MLQPVPDLKLAGAPEKDILGTPVEEWGWGGGKMLPSS